MVSQQVDFTLPLLLLQPEFSSSVAEGTTTAKEDEDSPKQPEPCGRQRGHNSDYHLRSELSSEIQGRMGREPEMDPFEDSHQSS